MKNLKPSGGVLSGRGEELKLAPQRKDTGCKAYRGDVQQDPAATHTSPASSRPRS